MKRQPLIFIALIILVTVGCKKENAMDCFKSNGSNTVESRDCGQFTMVRTFDKIDVQLHQGSQFQVLVTAGKNLLKNISIENKNGLLEITNNNKCNFVRGYDHRIVVDITMPRIDRIENQGVGTIQFMDEFIQDSIRVLAENSGDTHVKGKFKTFRSGSHGNGDIIAYGIADSVYVYCYGTNFFKGENLLIKSFVFVETLTIGDCTINAPINGPIAYNIWKSGNIYYFGTPTEILNYSKIEAAGKLINKD